MIDTRVLLVDDEPDVLLLLEVQFSLLDGFEVVGTASDGGECLDLVRRVRPDAVVLDLLMPRMSGFEAAALIRADFPEIAVVAHTGVAGEFVRNEMARLDVALVLKSGNVGPLADAVSAEVARRKREFPAPAAPE